MTPIPSATQWGSPSASKRAFLIHGGSSSSHTWETVAQMLVKAGFLVTAPNMLGHGHRLADDFHLQTFAQDLYSTYFANGSTYDVIIGHSLGGTVTLALLPLLSAPKKIAVILVEPGIQLSDDVLDEFERHFERMVERISVEAVKAEHPAWTRQDAVTRVVALYTAQDALAKRMFEHLRPYSYGHLFDVMPPHVEMTVLLADPALDGLPREQVPAHAQIRDVITVKGSGHWIHHENPDTVVRTTVDEVERLRVAA